MDELGRPSLEAYRQSDKLPYVLVLDNVRSMNNIGSVFRTADALNASGLILTGISARPPHRDISKTALGADESVAWQYFESNEAALAYLKEHGYTLVCIEQVSNSISLEHFVPAPDKKYAYVLGNEVFGVSDDIVAQADLHLEIPQFGTKHSLNVSVTAGIISWHHVLHSIKP